MNSHLKSNVPSVSNTLQRRSGFRAGRILTLIFLTCLCIINTGCSLFVSSKKEIISYAEKTYGECEYIRKENGGIGKERYRTVYLRDKETGIEYSVTSSLEDLYIDGSTGLYLEEKNSDYEEAYVRYVMDLSQDELDEILTKNNLFMNKLQDYEYMFFDQYWEFLSNDPVDEVTAGNIAREICDVVKKNDCKNSIEIYCSIYTVNPDNYWSYDPSAVNQENKVFFADNCILIGSYDSSEGKWNETYALEAIDYVKRKYDAGLVFADCQVYDLSILMTEDQIREFYHGKTPDDKVRFYQFTDASGSNVYALTPYEDGVTPAEFQLFKDSEDDIGGSCFCLEPVR